LHQFRESFRRIFIEYNNRRSFTREHGFSIDQAKNLRETAT
jgi:hypothetical protein